LSNGGLSGPPGKQGAPGNAGKKVGVESWALSFDALVDSACALYSCFHHVWYIFTKGSNGEVGGIG